MEITDKKFFQSVIAVVDYVAAGNRKVSYNKGIELSGGYWPAVRRLFKEEHCVSLDEGGDMYVTRLHMLNPVYEECLSRIAVIEKAEVDRELSNREKAENIKYGKKGYELSKIAIWLSALAIAVEILRAMLDLLL